MARFGWTVIKVGCWIRKCFRIRRAVTCRGVAQPGSAPALGAGGRAFKSPRPDQTLYLQYVKHHARALFSAPAHMSQVQWTADPQLKNKDFYSGCPLRIGIFLLRHLQFRLQSDLFSPMDRSPFKYRSASGRLYHHRLVQSLSCERKDASRTESGRTKETQQCRHRGVSLSQANASDKVGKVGEISSTKRAEVGRPEEADRTTCS